MLLHGKARSSCVLVSPIAFENQSATRDLPNGEKENANLILYSAAVETVAKKNGLTFIDLFSDQSAVREGQGALHHRWFCPHRCRLSADR